MRLKLRARQLAAAKELSVPVEFAGPSGLKLRLIPSGTYMMGSKLSAKEVQKRANTMGSIPFVCEHPQHRVRITEPFYFGVYEVTEDQYEEFGEFGGTATGLRGAEELVRGQMDGSRYPVNCVSGARLSGSVNSYQNTMISCTASQPRPNGSTHAEQEQTRTFLSEISTAAPLPSAAGASRLGVSAQTPGDCTTCAVMRKNGVPIGSGPTITDTRQSTTPRGRRQARIASAVVVHGQMPRSTVVRLRALAIAAPRPARPVWQAFEWPARSMQSEQAWARTTMMPLRLEPGLGQRRISGSTIPPQISQANTVRSGLIGVSSRLPKPTQKMCPDLSNLRVFDQKPNDDMSASVAPDFQKPLPYCHILY